MNPLKLIDGWKTEIGLVAFAALAVALRAEWIDQDTFNTWAIVVGTWTGVAIKHAIKKSGSQ